MVKLRLGTYIVNAVIFLFSSGSIVKQVDSLVEWATMIRKHGGRKTTQDENRLLLIEEVKSRAVSISGHIFVMDYNAVFNVNGHI